MRFFSRKKDQARPGRPDIPYSIKLSGRDYDQLDICDSAIKFWLPETVEKKIDEMCSFQDTSASDLIRQILFIHLYGRYDLFGLIERQNHTYQLNSLPKFSLRSIDHLVPLPIPIEKNIADVKVWVPAKMKEDILMLAKDAGKKPSAYVRETIITHLFGHVPPGDISPEMSPPRGYEEEAFS
jgi:predicted DNA-binding protein